MLLRSRSRLWLPACILALFFLVLLFRSSPEAPPVRTSAPSPAAPAPKYEAGIPKPAGQNYSRTVVIASLAQEHTKWLSNLADDPNLSTAVYVVDKPQAPLTVPKNKGHEAMVYLTYIIDHYDRLSDVTMFMHAHRVTWHNNDLLFSDAIETIQRLSSPKVIRDGYMNLRCHWDPGCPDHIHPSVKDDNNGNTPEAVVIGRAWLELFPDAVAPPAVLSQPCCAQFALSKARILNLPLDRYIFFRRWLLNTEIADRVSGRIWEYVWQYIFAGVDEFCPVESICYCDGYGVCFGNEDSYQEWFAKRKESRELVDIRDSMGDDEKSNDEKLAIQVQLTHLDMKMSTLKKAAFLRGESPKNRALEAGREWKEGDGF